MLEQGMVLVCSTTSWRSGWGGGGTCLEEALSSRDVHMYPCMNCMQVGVVPSLLILHCLWPQGCEEKDPLGLAHQCNCTCSAGAHCSIQVPFLEAANAHPRPLLPPLIPGNDHSCDGGAAGATCTHASHADLKNGHCGMLGSMPLPALH